MIKDIIGYEELYSIDKNGNVYSKNKNKYIKPFYNKKTGYLYICLCKNKKTKKVPLHRLLAINFLENKENYPCINHIDGNKLNNNLKNLEWCSYSHNMKEAFRIGTGHTWCGEKFGVEHPNYKFRGKWKTQKPIEQLDLNGLVISRFNSATEIERNLGYSCSHISECCRYKRKSAYGYFWRYENER